MKLKKTLALTMAAMAVCASAFAGVSVKSYDVNEDWVKMEVPQVKGERRLGKNGSSAG